MKQADIRRNFLFTTAFIGAAALVAGCSAPPSTPMTSAPGARPVISLASPATFTQISVADTPLAYRHDAAAHLYSKNSDRIFKGILPMFLYAVAVVQVEVDSRGQLTSLTWMR